jgi:hypothetical protein
MLLNKDPLKEDSQVKRKKPRVVKECSRSDSVQNRGRQCRYFFYSVTAAFENHLLRNKILSSPPGIF